MRYFLFNIDIQRVSSSSLTRQVLPTIPRIIIIREAAVIAVVAKSIIIFILLSVFLFYWGKASFALFGIFWVFIFGFVLWLRIFCIIRSLIRLTIIKLFKIFNVGIIRSVYVKIRIITLKIAKISFSLVVRLEWRWLNLNWILSYIYLIFPLIVSSITERFLKVRFMIWDFVWAYTFLFVSWTDCTCASASSWMIDYLSLWLTDFKWLLIWWIRIIAILKDGWTWRLIQNISIRCAYNLRFISIYVLKLLKLRYIWLKVWWLTWSSLRDARWRKEYSPGPILEAQIIVVVYAVENKIGKETANDWHDNHNGDPHTRHADVMVILFLFQSNLLFLINLCNYCCIIIRSLRIFCYWASVHIPRKVVNNSNCSVPWIVILIWQVCLLVKIWYRLRFFMHLGHTLITTILLVPGTSWQSTTKQIKLAIVWSDTLVTKRLKLWLQLSHWFQVQICTFFWNQLMFVQIVLLIFHFKFNVHYKIIRLFLFIFTLYL